MQKIFFYTLLFMVGVCSASNEAAAQTSFDSLKAIVGRAPENTYGVKRVNYGAFSEIPGETNTWVTYNTKTSSYAIVVLVVGQTAFKDFIEFSETTKSLPIRDAVEALCEKLKPEKWIPEKW